MDHCFHHYFSLFILCFDTSSIMRCHANSHCFAIALFCHCSLLGLLLSSNFFSSLFHFAIASFCHCSNPLTSKKFFAIGSFCHCYNPIACKNFFWPLPLSFLMCQ
eukprot:888909_1